MLAMNREEMASNDSTDSSDSQSSLDSDENEMDKLFYLMNRRLSSSSDSVILTESSDLPNSSVSSSDDETGVSKVKRLAAKRTIQKKGESVSHDAKLNKIIDVEWEKSLKIAQYKKNFFNKYKNRSKKILASVSNKREQKEKGEQMNQNKENKKSISEKGLDMEGSQTKISIQNIQQILNKMMHEDVEQMNEMNPNLLNNPRVILIDSDDDDDEIALRLMNYQPPPLLAGRLFSMGKEFFNELGPRISTFDGQVLNQNEPGRVRIYGNTKILHVAAGFNHSVVITDQGQVLSFGHDHDYVLGRPTTNKEDYQDFIQQQYINDLDYAKELATIADKPGGGTSKESEDTNQNQSNMIDELEESLALKILPVSQIDTKVVRVSAGEMHSAVLGLNGKVYIWGQFK